MSAYPTPWQKRTMWAALTALFVVLLIVIAGAVVYLGASLISFLQPILIPVAIAAILAYLLDPLVTELCRRKMGRGMAIAVIFTSVFIALVGLFWWVVPTISLQSANFARELPGYTQKARDRIVDLIVQYNRVVGGTAGRGKSASSGLVTFLLGTPPPHAPSPTPAAAPTPSPQTTASPVETISAAPVKISSAERQQLEAKADKVIPNLERYLPTLADKIWNIIKRSEEHTSELQSRFDLVCRLLLEKKNKTIKQLPCVGRQAAARRRRGRAARPGRRPRARRQATRDARGLAVVRTPARLRVPVYPPG